MSGEIWFLAAFLAPLLRWDSSPPRQNSGVQWHGEHQIIDAGSSNGTTVNGFSVCTKQAGPPTNLKSGDSIRFGQVDTTFLDAKALRSFVLKFDA
jgi:hypothetical protein